MSGGEQLSLEAALALRLTVSIGAPVAIGATLAGDTTLIPITGGTVEGPGIRGEILPGGADWNSSVQGGLTDFHARYSFRTEDGACVTVINEGLTDADFGRSFIKTRTRFLADRHGPHAHLLSGVHVGALDASEAGQGRVHITIYRLK